MSIGYDDGSVLVSNVLGMSLNGIAMVYVEELDPTTNRAMPEKRLQSVTREVELFSLWN